MDEVVVAVLTYRRNDELASLLPVLHEQIQPLGRPVSVLVVDNDPSAGAGPVVEAYDGATEVRYVHEATPGIAAARNRALDESASLRYLVFLDDDEIPQPEWLASLLGTVERTSAAAVVGPVESVFDVSPDDWVQAGNFFRRRRPPTGTRVDVAATNNLLLDLAVVRRLGLRFDAAFGLSGGSDTLFTRQLAGSGELMVWCDEALVLDRVPAGRVTRQWVLDRAFRSGNSWSRTSLVLAAGPLARWRVRATLAARGAVRVAGGAAQALLGRATRDLGAQANGERRLRRGAGMLAGLVGHVHVEYARPGHKTA